MTFYSQCLQGYLSVQSKSERTPSTGSFVRAYTVWKFHLGTIVSSAAGWTVSAVLTIFKLAASRIHHGSCFMHVLSHLGTIAPEQNPSDKEMTQKKITEKSIGQEM